MISYGFCIDNSQNTSFCILITSQKTVQTGSYRRSLQANSTCIFFHRWSGQVWGGETALKGL